MFKELYQEALFKLVYLIIITLMLNILCEQNLEIVAWIIVLVPFILMTEMIIMLVYIFGVNVSNGTIDYKKDENSTDEEPPVSVVFVKNPPQGSSSPAYS
jgi:archaellum biogenesis protein FlaJ (TadC family)